jgi:hypothetical protein
MAETPNNTVSKLGLSSDRTKSVAKLREIGSNSVRTVNELGEVLQSLQKFSELDLRRQTGLNRADLDKWRIYRDQVISQVNKEDPGSIYEGKYYPGKGKTAEPLRAQKIESIKKEQAPGAKVLSRGLVGDVLGFGKGFAKGVLARPTAAAFAKRNLPTDWAFETAPNDAAERIGAGTGFGFEQNFLPTATSVPGLTAGGMAAGAIDRGLGKFLPNNPMINLLRVGGRVAGAMGGAAGANALFDKFGNPLSGLPDEQRKAIEGQAAMALGGPEQKLGQFAATASVFGAPARSSAGRISMFEGAGVIPSGQAIMRNANKAFANPEVQETIGDVGERLFSIWQTDKEITDQNKSIETGFQKKFGRRGSKDELKQYGYVDNNERLLQMAPDIIFGGMSKYGSSLTGSALFNQPPTPGATPSPTAPTQSPMAAQTGQPATIAGGAAQPAQGGRTARPLNIRVNIRDDAAGVIPHRITYDPATRTADVSPARSFLPSNMAIAISEKLAAIGAPFADGVAIRSVTPEGEFVITRPRATGEPVVETVTFNELPDAWKAEVDKAFNGTPNAQGQVRPTSTLPTDGVYNPIQDANPVYEKQYKHKINVDGRDVFAAIVKVKGNDVTVQLPSGLRFDVPKTAFKPDTEFKVSIPSAEPISISDIKAGVGDAKFPVAAEYDGTDFFVPQVNRAGVAAEPASWRERFYRTTKDPNKSFTEFGGPITRGTVVDLGIFNGVRQFGVVLAHRVFDLNGKQAAGYEVKSITTPNARTFMVPIAGMKPVEAGVDPTSIIPETTAAAPAPAPAATATGAPAGTPATSVVPTEGAVVPTEGVDTSAAGDAVPTEGVEPSAEGIETPTGGVVTPTEGDEPAPFNATSEFSEFEFSKLTPEQQLEVLTDGRLANWMFKVVQPSQWDALSNQRRQAIMLQAVKDPLFVGEVVGDIVQAAESEQQYLPAEGEPVIYGDRQNTEPGSFTHTIDLVTARALGTLNPNINIGFGDFIKSGASNWIVNALYNTDVIAGPDDTPTFTDGKWYRFLKENVGLENDEAFDFVGGSESPVIAKTVEGEPTPTPTPTPAPTDTGTEVPTDAVGEPPTGVAEETPAFTPEEQSVIDNVNEAIATGSLGRVSVATNNWNTFSDAVKNEIRRAVDAINADVVAPEPGSPIDFNDGSQRFGLMPQNATGKVAYTKQAGIKSRSNEADFVKPTVEFEVRGAAAPTPTPTPTPTEEEDVPTPVESEPIVSETPEQPVVNEDEEETPSSGQVPPENQQFPFGYEFKTPAVRGSIPESMEAGRTEAQRYRTLAPGSEESKRITIDDFRRAVPTWASGINGFKRFVGKLIVPLFQNKDVRGKWELSVKGVSNKVELKEVFMETWGQTDDQATALSEWVDRFSISWAREFARLHGIRTMDRLRAIRLPSDPQISPDMITKEYDEWRQSYREQMIPADEEAIKIIATLQKVFYTQRLGVIAAMAANHKNMLGTTGATFSIQANGDQVVTVAVALQGKENYNTQVHEINHALVRSLYMPMIHQLAAKVYASYAQGNTKRNLATIQKDIEEQIVTELTNEMFNSPNAGNYNFFSSNSNVEGGFDATLNRLIQDIGNQMRSSGYTPGSENDLDHSTGWRVEFNKDNREQHVSGTPMIVRYQGQFVEGVLAERFTGKSTENSAKIRIDDGTPEGKIIKVPFADIRGIGRTNVEGLSAGGREYMIKFLGHWYGFTADKIKELAPSVPVNDVGFITVDVAQVERQTVGYRWWDSVAKAREDLGKYTSKDFSDDRIRHRMGESYLGWADAGGYEQYRKSDIPGQEVEPVLVSTVGLSVQQIPGEMQASVEDVASPEAFGFDDFAGMNVPDDIEDSPIPLDASMAGDVEAFETAQDAIDTSAVVKDGSFNFWNDQIIKAVERSFTSTRASRSTKNDPLFWVLRSPFIPGFVNKWIMPKVHLRRGFEFARVQLSNQGYAVGSFDEWYTRVAGGADQSNAINSTVYAAAYEAAEKMLGGITKGAAANTFNVTVVDPKTGVSKQVVVAKRNLPSYLYKAMKNSANKAITQLISEFTAHEPKQSESYVATAERAVMDDGIFIDAYPQRVESQTIRRATAQQLITNYNRAKDKGPRISFKSWMQNPKNTENMSPELVTNLNDILNSDNNSADKIGNLIREIKGDATSRNSLMLSVVGSNNALHTVFLGTDTDVTVPSFTEEAMEAAHASMSKLYEKEKTMVQTRMLITYEDAVGDSGIDFFERLSDPTDNLEAMDFDAQAVAIDRKSRMAEINRIKDILSSGAKFSSAYKDMYQNTHNKNLEAVTARRDGLQAKVDGVIASNKKPTKTLLSSLEKANAEVENANKLYSDFVDTSVDYATEVFDILNEHATHIDVYMDFFKYIQARAYTASGVISLARKYANHAQLKNVFLAPDNVLYKNLDVLGDAYKYITTIDNNFSSTVKITDGYVAVSKRLTPIQYIVLEATRAMRQTVGIKPKFVDTSATSGYERVSKGFNIGAATILKARKEIVQRINDVEQGIASTDGQTRKLGLFDKTIEARPATTSTIRSVVGILDNFINDIETGAITKSVEVEKDGVKNTEEQPVFSKTYFDMLTQNEKRLHLLVELPALGTSDKMYSELVKRLSPLGSTDVSNTGENTAINATVDALVRSSVIPPTNVWTKATQITQGVATVRKISAPVTDIVDIAKRVLVNANDEVVRACDDDIQVNRNKDYYVNLLERMGVTSKGQTVFTNDQLRAIARIGNEGNDTQAALDFMRLQTGRNEYVTRPLSKWLSSHNTSLSQMTIGELNSYMLDTGMSSDDSFAVMSSILKIMTQQRSMIMPFVVQNGRLPLKSELPTLAKQLFDSRRGKDTEALTLESLNAQYNSLVENVASYGLTYMTNSASVTLLEGESLKQLDASTGLYGLMITADPTTMDHRNAEVRSTLLTQAKMFGSKDASNIANDVSVVSAALSDVASRDAMPDSLKAKIDRVVRDTERLNAKDVADVLFRYVRSRTSTSIPAPGKKTPIQKIGTNRATPEFEFVENVRKKALDVVSDVFDQISSGDSARIDARSAFGFNKKTAVKMLTSPEFANEPANYDLMARMRLFTEALAKDMIQARFELIRALNDDTLRLNTYRLKNNMVNLAEVEVLNPAGELTMTINYNTGTWKKINSQGLEVVGTLSKANESLGLTNGQRALRDMLVSMSGVINPERPAPDATESDRIQYEMEKRLFVSTITRITDSVNQVKALRVVPAEYWVGKDQVQVRQSDKPIEPMYMNPVVDDAEHVNYLAGTRDPETIDNYVKPVVMKWIKPDGDGYQRVQLNDNGVPAYDGYGYTVMDANGGRSHTYAKLRANGLSADKALEVYALTEHPEFKAWQAGDHVESIELADPGIVMGQRSMDYRRRQQVRNVVMAEKLKGYIDKYIAKPNAENFEWLKFHYDELFGHDLKTDEELQKAVQDIVGDNVKLEALRTRADGFAALNTTADVQHFVNPTLAYMNSQKPVRTGQPFTTMAFDYATQGILSFRNKGIQAHDLGSGMHDNANHSSRARFIKFENPLVIDLKNSGVDTAVMEKYVTKAFTRGHDGIVFTNYADSMFSPTRKNVAVTLDDANVRYIPEMITGTKRKAKAVAKAFEPMFMNPLVADVTRETAPDLMEPGMVDQPKTTGDKVKEGALGFSTRVFDEYQSIVRAPLSLDWAFTTIQGGKALLGFLTGRPYDTMFAVKALIGSWAGMMPNSSITMFGKKIGFDKLGRRKYMEAYIALRKDPFWEEVKKSGAPLHMFNLERRIEGERDRLYQEANGEINYNDIRIDLMDYDERGNLTDFFEKGTIISQFPLQGMAERQISLQHDLLLFQQVKHQLMFNPVLKSVPLENKGSHPDAKHIANFLALSMGDFQYSTDERKDAIWGRAGKLMFVAPRWMFANFLVNPIGNTIVSNTPFLNDWLRKNMGVNNRVFDLYDSNSLKNNPALVKYQWATTVGTAAWMLGFQYLAEIVGQLMGNGTVNGNIDRFGSYRLGDWKIADSTGSLDSANLFMTNWKAAIGGDPGYQKRFAAKSSQEEWAFKILNTLGYRASPVFTKPIAALFGRDVLNRPVWQRDESVATVWRDLIAPSMQKLGADVPDDLEASMFITTTFPSFYQEYVRSYATAKDTTDDKAVASAIAMEQLVASFFGTRIQYDPYIPYERTKYEARKSAMERAWEYAPSAKDIIETNDLSQFLTGLR